MKTPTFDQSRRSFIKQTGLFGLSLVIGLDAQAKAINMSRHPFEGTGIEISPFILIDTLNHITIINPRPDMGQGTLQSMPSLIAEELEVDLERVTVVQSDGKSKYGSQTSGGSTSVQHLWLPLRKAGAAVREMLIKAAATRWNVSESACYASNAVVHLRGSSKQLTYGQLVEEASRLPVPAQPTLKDPKDFKILGKNFKKLDTPARVTGKAVYGIDVDVPGMIYACIAHAPMLFDKVVSYDDSATRKVPGVLEVMKCERKMIHRMAEGVAVIASNFWAAYKGREALKVSWSNDDLPEKLHTEMYFKSCYDAAKTEGILFQEKGDFRARFNAAKQTLDVTYETPFLAHVPVEPENATVHVRESGEVEIWAPVQGPAETLNEVAEYLQVPPDKIKVNATLLGGSYGKKAYIDFVKEACYLSSHLKRPVKLIWTREDDVTQGPYRPGMLSHMQGYVEDGKIGFHHHAIGESIMRQVFSKLADNQADATLCENISSKSSNYLFNTEKISWTNVKTEIPIMWWRSVNMGNFAWGQECFIDELAHLVGKDPVQLRFDLLEDKRCRTVLETLVKKSRYDEPLPVGTGKGISLFNSFGSFCGCCVTVSKAVQGIVIEKVVSVIDCGHYVSADGVKSQTEGNIVMAISAAIKGGIVWKRGVCQQRNYNDYHVLRIHEMPDIEVHIVESGEAPGGVGEAGLPPVAPALGNAIFAATGVRVRNLPIDIKKLTI